MTDIFRHASLSKLADDVNMLETIEDVIVRLDAMSIGLFELKARVHHLQEIARNGEFHGAE